MRPLRTAADKEAASVPGDKFFILLKVSPNSDYRSNFESETGGRESVSTARTRFPSASKRLPVSQSVCSGYYKTSSFFSSCFGIRHLGRPRLGIQFLAHFWISTFWGKLTLSPNRKFWALCEVDTSGGAQCEPACLHTVCDRSATHSKSHTVIEQSYEL